MLDELQRRNEAWRAQAATGAQGQAAPAAQRASGAPGVGRAAGAAAQPRPQAPPAAAAPPRGQAAGEEPPRCAAAGTRPGQGPPPPGGPGPGVPPAGHAYWNDLRKMQEQYWAARRAEEAAAQAAPPRQAAEEEQPRRGEGGPCPGQAPPPPAGPGAGAPPPGHAPWTEMREQYWAQRRAKEAAARGAPPRAGGRRPFKEVRPARHRTGRAGGLARPSRPWALVVPALLSPCTVHTAALFDVAGQLRCCTQAQGISSRLPTFPLADLRAR